MRGERERERSKAMAEFWPSRHIEPYAHRRASYYDISTLYTDLGHKTTDRYKDTLSASKYTDQLYIELAWAEHGTANDVFSMPCRYAHSGDTNSNSIRSDSVVVRNKIADTWAEVARQLQRAQRHLHCWLGFPRTRS